MIKADFHLRRDVHMCGQERSWQVFKKNKTMFKHQCGGCFKVTEKAPEEYEE